MKGGGGPRRSDHPEASLPLYVSCPSCFTADNMSLAITLREREKKKEITVVILPFLISYLLLGSFSVQMNMDTASFSFGSSSSSH